MVEDAVDAVVVESCKDCACRLVGLLIDVVPPFVTVARLVVGPWLVVAENSRGSSIEIPPSAAAHVVQNDRAKFSSAIV